MQAVGIKTICLLLMSGMYVANKLASGVLNNLVLPFMLTSFFQLEFAARSGHLLTTVHDG